MAPPGTRPAWDRTVAGLGESGTRLVRSTRGLYESLEAETGLATGYHNVGGVIVARTGDRMVQLRRGGQRGRLHDLPCELGGCRPSGPRALPPMGRRPDQHLTPGDGKVNPTDVTQSLAIEGRPQSGRCPDRRRVRVTGIDVVDGRVTRCPAPTKGGWRPVVVNCAGQWAKAVGGSPRGRHRAAALGRALLRRDQRKPSRRPPDLPIMRDPDGWTYFKEGDWRPGRRRVRPDAKPWRSPDDLPYPFEFQLLDEDWGALSVLMDQ